MDEYIARQNIERFQQLLATELDAAERTVLLQLLAEEEKKLAALREASGRGENRDD
jgi:hypothetical protein